MRLDEYFEFLGPDQIRIKGHRIGIEHVVELYREGDSPEQIALRFPGLSLENIYATITYYLHNQTEVDAYLERQLARLRQEIAEADARGPSPPMKRVRALLAEREAKGLARSGSLGSL
jgi:uncharacterized protein (DUF433 family)